MRKQVVAHDRPAPQPPRSGHRAHRGRTSLRALLGLALVGYGVLVLIGLTVHESSWLALASLACGGALLWRRLPQVDLQRRVLVASIGMFAVAGVLIYNVVRGSDLSLPEWAILVYGVALLVASFYLHRRIGTVSIGTAVAWSFPLLLAPLAMFATNAAFSQGQASTSAGPVVHALVVVPTSLLMAILGTPVALAGNNMILQTPRGGLTLGVGLVCAGLYPMILFAGLLGLHAWQSGMRPGRFAVHLSVGLLALWFLNVIRLVILAHVGLRKGGEALQTTHAHIGWVMFALFMLVYWTIVGASGRRHRRAQPQ